MIGEDHELDKERRLVDESRWGWPIMDPDDKKRLIGEVVLESNEVHIELSALEVQFRRHVQNWIAFGKALESRPEDAIDDLASTLGATDKEELLVCLEKIRVLRKRRDELASQQSDLMR